MGEQQKSKKEQRYRQPFGGDEDVDRHGISTKNHMELYHHLVKGGPRMHNHPGPRKPHKS